MKKVLNVIRFTIVVLFCFSFSLNSFSAPVTVTVDVDGGFIRTDRWTDPSTCRTFDRVVCGSGNICFSFTYTYDDGTQAYGDGLPIGPINPPIHLVISQNPSVIINEGLVSFYDEGALVEEGPGVSSFTFTFDNQCQE